ncbi:MAG: hypothetical protein JWQ27_2698 [Ferruginibacter sp.]|nr:hypothetical protein [Ferruginibacter sp.]
MLITIIYRFFQLGFILVALFGIATITAVVSRAPLSINSLGTEWVLGQHGLSGNALQVENASDPASSLQVETNTAGISDSSQPALTGGLLRQQIQVIPQTAGQRTVVMGYDLLFYGSLSLAFYALYRLFRNFHFKRYFFLENARYLRLSGMFLLLNAALSFGMSLCFLSGLKVVKFALLNGVQTVVGKLHFPLELDGISLSLAICLLVLANIFKKATEVKEDRDSFA